MRAACPAAEAFIPKVRNVLDTARGADIRVFFCRHMTLPNEVAGVSQLRGAMALQRVSDPSEVEPSFLRSSPGFPIVPELEPLPSEAVFDKLAMSAFVGSLLDFAWRRTHCSSRRGPRLLPFVIEDACYSFSPDAKKSSLDVARRMGAVTDRDTFAASLREEVKA